MNSGTYFNVHISDLADLIEKSRVLTADFESAADRLVECLTHGGKVLWCGNGGSAADASHMSAELVGRYAKERRGIASIALSTDPVIITALGNDYSFEHIFVRQIEALARPGDVLMALSTSGESRNVLEAAKVARAMEVTVIAMTGAGPNSLSLEADHAMCVPSQTTAHIQEMHQAIGHSLCGWIETTLLP